MYAINIPVYSTFTILFHLSIHYITAGEKVLMEIWYSLLVSQSAESNELSPKLPQAQGILHDLSLWTVHILPITGIWISAGSSLFPWSFGSAVDQRQIPFYYCYFVLMLVFIWFVFHWVQQALAFRTSAVSHIAGKKREKVLLSFKHKCDIRLQLLKPELPLWVALYFLKTAL